MSLRVRLIVAFFLLSVVPLGAVTFYSYTSNELALRAAARHETEMLTAELTQRMQVVTAQISERVEHLMDMPVTTTVAGTSGRVGNPPRRTQVARAETKAAQPPAPATPSAAAPEVSAAAHPDPATIEGQVAASLGEVAMLLNNVELRGLGRRGGGPRQPAAAGDAANPVEQASAQTGRSDRPFPSLEFAGRGGRGRRADAGAPSGTPPVSVDASSPVPGRGVPGPNGGQRSGPTGVVADTTDPTHMKIDLAPIRRELFRELTSDEQFQQLTPEERARIGREVNQRLLGIVQGIQLGAAEVQKKADAARQQAAAASAKAEGASTAHLPAPAAPAPNVAAPAAPLPPPAPTASVQAVPATPPSEKTASAAAPPPAPAPPLPAKPMTRKADLTGTKLNVRMERNGEVVQQVNAELNLPNLLATVFANTRRDSGEIPFAVGKDGHLYAPTDADRTKLASLNVERLDAASGTTRVDNWIIVTMPDRSGAGLRFGIARPVGNLLTDLRRTTARNAGFGLLFIAIALVGIVPLSTRLTRNLSSLTDGVSRIARGDYTARVPVKSHDEVGRLADAFNRMAADVEQHQRAAVEQERIRRELELGRRIQSEMLPRAPLTLGPIEIKGVSVPAREVGGDFFNYFALASGHVAMLVGDVSGKGVGAALLMANIQASLRARFALGQELSAIAEAIDRDIEASSPGPAYATLFMAILDPASRRMRYVNAGHNPQFVLRAGGDLESMPATGLPVGMLAGHGYREREMPLAPGDLLFFYTDGCVEMENEAGDMFGSDRLESLIVASAGRRADEVLASAEQAISSFRGTREQFDDATMMAVTIG